MTTTNTTATRKIDNRLVDYGKSHLNLTNEVIHFVAIPLMIAFIAASGVYYAQLSTVFLERWLFVLSKLFKKLAFNGEPRTASRQFAL